MQGERNAQAEGFQCMAPFTQFDDAFQANPAANAQRSVGVGLDPLLRDCRSPETS